MLQTIDNIRIASRPRNVVIRQVCDRRGNVIDHLAERHNGSPQDVVAAARRVSRRMFAAYEDASNIASRIVATDERGRARWSVSPNFQIVTEL